MEWPKAKTALIYLMLIVNLLLGMVYFSRTYESLKLRGEMAEDAVSALGKLGVTVPLELLKVKTEPIYTLEVERNEKLEQDAFSALIGEATIENQGGGNILMTGSIGTAKLSGDGVFSVNLGDNQRISVNLTAGKPASAVFMKMGIDIGDDIYRVFQTADGFIVRGIQSVRGADVFNREYELTFDSRGMYKMEGGRVLGEMLVSDKTSSRSIITVLFAFTDAMKELGTPCKEIVGAKLGYYAESSAPNYTQLSPVWEIESDLGIYYIDAVHLELIRNLLQ